MTATSDSVFLSATPSTSPSARRYPLSYVLSGYYSWGSGTLANQDSGGYWWSTAAVSASNAYNLAMASSVLYPQDSNTKALGFALRCVSLGFIFSRRYPLSYVFSGYYNWNGGYSYDQNDYGDWWSSRPVNSGTSYALAVHSSYLQVNYTNDKNRGYTLRCVSYSICVSSVSAFVCIVRTAQLGDRRIDMAKRPWLVEIIYCTRRSKCILS